MQITDKQQQVTDLDQRRPLARSETCILQWATTINLSSQQELEYQVLLDPMVLTTITVPRGFQKECIREGQVLRTSLRILR